jgi:2-polyprenyl-6-hydroxyphenyl methylase/3-demethylubiquinone-9 3-methyltransferase
VISTIYHGYLKNVALALLGRFDRHVDPLWDHGHIKFFSERTLTKLLEETGFEGVTISRPDLVPQFARSMVARARKPSPR